MSALPSDTPKRVEHRIRVGIRDGEIVRLKFCPGCGQDKIASDTKKSEFSVNKRGPDGSVRGWRPLCKKCKARETQAYRDRDREASRRLARETTARIFSDPERAAFRRDQMRQWARKRREEDPEFAERRRQQGRAWRERKLREDPEFFSAARRAERAAFVSRPPSPIDGTSPRVLAEPMRRWLRAYEVVAGFEGRSDALAEHLGIEPRRVRSLYRRETLRVSVDIVSRALTNAAYVVEIDGRPIVTYDDLYPED